METFSRRNSRGLYIDLEAGTPTCNLIGSFCCAPDVYMEQRLPVLSVLLKLH